MNKHQTSIKQHKQVQEKQQLIYFSIFARSFVNTFHILKLNDNNSFTKNIF